MYFPEGNSFGFRRVWKENKTQFVPREECFHLENENKQTNKQQALTETTLFLRSKCPTNAS